MEYKISRGPTHIKPGYIYVPYVIKTVSSSINGETVWYANRFKNFLLHIKHFFIKPRYLKNTHVYSKKKIDGSLYTTINIKKS